MGIRHKIALLVLALMSFHALNNYLILKRDKSILDPDAVSYYSGAHEIVDAASSTGLGTAVRTLFTLWKPPLIYLAAAPFVYSGGGIETAALVNILFLGLTMLAIYGICRILFSARTGILAALLFSLFPSVFALSRVLAIESALTAIVAITAYLFLSNPFDRPETSLLAGSAIGLGFLTKQTYAIFLVPMLFDFIAREENRKCPKRMRYFSLALSLALAISAAWYLQEDWSYYGIAFLRWGKKIDPWFYIDSLYNRQLLPVFAASAALSFALFLKQRKYFLPLSSAFILLFFSLSTKNQDERFILPIFPYIAIMIAHGVESLSRKLKTGSPRLLIALFGFMQFYAVSYRPFAFMESWKKDHSIYSEINENGLYSIDDEGMDWRKPSEEAVRLMQSAAKKRDFRVVLISQSGSNIEYYLARAGVRSPVVRDELDVDTANCSLDLGVQCDLSLGAADFVLLDEPYDWTTRKSKLLKREFERQRGDFAHLASITFPNNIVLLAYRRRRH